MTQAEAALVADPLNSDDLELAVASLKRKLEVLIPLDAELLTMTSEIDHADQYEESVLTNLYKAISGSGHIPRVDAAPIIETPRVIEREGGDRHARVQKVNLPQISLPRFNGDPVK